MTTSTRSTRTLPAIAVIADPAGALLDELDDLVTELDAALGDQTAARATLADTELELAVVEANHVLAIEGRNEHERKAHLTLALRSSDEYQVLSETARAARSTLWHADRRLTVIKHRITLVRAALDLLADRGDRHGR